MFAKNNTKQNPSLWQTIYYDIEKYFTSWKVHVAA